MSTCRIDRKLDVIGLRYLGDPHSEEITRSVDPAVAVRTCGMPVAVMVGAFSVENSVVVILCAVHPEQVALLENARGERLFLCAEIYTVYAEVRPCGSDRAHDRERVDL